MMPVRSVPHSKRGKSRWCSTDWKKLGTPYSAVQRSRPTASITGTGENVSRRTIVAP